MNLSSAPSFADDTQGVYANLTINLADTFDSTFFRVFGAIYAIGTLILWTFIATRTVIKVYDRTIFEALEDLRTVLEIQSNGTEPKESHSPSGQSNDSTNTLSIP